ncbi:MAG: phosphatase PAP2 family protein [Chitinophagaceae bacterium]|nr:MAG: phosphatase PAP2 family protein [Chitinophagaceae bacterium]
MRFRPGIFCFLLIACSAHAQDTTKAARVDTDSSQVVVADSTYPTRKLYKLNKAYVLGYFTDLKHVVTRPAHWKGKDWRNFSIFLGVTAATMAADWEIRRIVLANQGSIATETAKVVEPFGNFYGVYLFPVMYVAGLATNEKRMQSVALGGVKSLAISTLIYASSKLIIRRGRPDKSESSWDYGPPFGNPLFTSSPSGHSNTIFTVATALALEYRETKWVPIVAYTIAGLTATSRIYQNRHWASDVVIGSALGHFVTKAVWKNNNKKQTRKQLW